MRNNSTLMRRALVALGAGLLAASVANANVGTGLPLDEYQVGSEQTNGTIVNNGGFETVVAGQPAGWTLNNSFGVGSAIGPNSQTTGTTVAQGPLGGVDQTFPAFNGYSQPVTLLPNTTYVISAYMWNFGQNFDLIGAEVRDSAFAAITGGSVYLTRMDAAAQNPALILDGSRGVFGYSGFTTGPGTDYTLLVKFDQDSSGAAPNIGGQIDNVSITPLANFRPPSVPEPATAVGLVAVATAAALRRRRRA